MEIALCQIRGYVGVEHKGTYFTAAGGIALFHETAKMNKSSATELANLIQEKHLIVLYDHEAPSTHCTEVLEKGGDRYLELVDTALLKTRVLYHSLQPKYIVVQMPPDQLPVILTASPVARLYGWRAGTVVEAIVQSPVSGVVSKFFQIQGPVFRR